MCKNELFDKIQELLNIELDEKKRNEILEYYHLIIETNKSFNLTRITKLEDFLIKNVLDSLLLNEICTFSKGDPVVFDLGSGAGFPGIILKIVFPNIKLYIIETLNKRCEFLRKVANTLNLENVYVIHGRAEIEAYRFADTADYVVARAFSSLSVVLEFAFKYLKIGGCAVAMRSSNYKSDLESAKEAIGILGYNLIKEQLTTLFKENALRYNALFQKTRDIKGYPRKFNEVKNNPL